MKCQSIFSGEVCHLLNLPRGWQRLTRNNIEKKKKKKKNQSAFFLCMKPIYEISTSVHGSFAGIIYKW